MSEDTNETDENPRYRGFVNDGGCRVEDAENPNAWIEVEYRDGWVGRKLMVDDTTAYEEMIKPFYLKCRSCHRHDSPQMWTADSQYCPMCEIQIQNNIPAAFGWFFGDDEPTPPKIDEI